MQPLGDPVDGQIDQLELRQIAARELTTRSLAELTRTWRRLRGMNALSNWPRNRLLLALPSSNLKRLMPELEQIRCQRGQVLMDADSSLECWILTRRPTMPRTMRQWPASFH
jgi:hypothetical protein